VKGWRFWLIWISLLIALLLSFHFGPVGVLCLESPGQRRVFWFHPLAVGDTLELVYEHSMYRVSQKEVYQCGGTGGWILRKMVFGSFAAAAYYDPEGMARRIGTEDYWEMVDLARSFPELRIFVNHSHRLFLGDQTIGLAAQFGDGSRVCIKKRSYPQLILILGLERAEGLIRAHFTPATQGRLS